MARQTALPSITIDAATKKAVRDKSFEEGISISAFIRAALHLWARNDPGVYRILDQVKRDKKEKRRVL